MSYAEVYLHLLDYVVQRIHDERRPGEPIIWGGDFNQALTGRDYVGTHLGREGLLPAFALLELKVPTVHLPALIDAHPAIDHIAIPGNWSLVTAPVVHAPMHAGKNLSDHALYVVKVDPTWATLASAIET